MKVIFEERKKVAEGIEVFQSVAEFEDRVFLKQIDYDVICKVVAHYSPKAKVLKVEVDAWASQEIEPEWLDSDFSGKTYLEESNDKYSAIRRAIQIFDDFCDRVASGSKSANEAAMEAIAKAKQEHFAHSLVESGI